MAVDKPKPPISNTPERRNKRGDKRGLHLAVVGLPYRWKPGQTGNPGGERKLPEAIKQMKDLAFDKAIELLYSAIHDPKLAKRKMELICYLREIFDRLGLPRQTQTKIEVGNDLAERLAEARKRRILDAEVIQPKDQLNQDSSSEVTMPVNPGTTNNPQIGHNQDTPEANK